MKKRKNGVSYKSMTHRDQVNLLNFENKEKEKKGMVLTFAERHPDVYHAAVEISKAKKQALDEVKRWNGKK